MRRPEAALEAPCSGAQASSPQKLARGVAEADVLDAAVLGIGLAFDEPFRFEHRKALGKGAAGDAEVFGDGDRDVAIAVRPLEVGQDQQVHRLKAVLPGAFLSPCWMRAASLSRSRSSRVMTHCLETNSALL